MKNLIGPVLILITVLITKMGSEEVFYTQVGGDVTLRMPRDTLSMYRFFYFGSKTGIRLAWVNPWNGRGLTEDTAWDKKLFLTDDSLIIKNVQEGNFGTIFLTVSHGRPTATDRNTYKLIRLKVSVFPGGLVLPGELLSLECDVELPQGQQAPDIHWLNPQGERVDETSKGRVVVKASIQHNGSWTCVVGNKNNAKTSVSVMGLNPGVLHQYMSTSSPLSLPCSIPTYISWEQIKQMGVQEVQWHFSPKPSTSLPPGERQRLFSLSLEGALTWGSHREKGLSPAGDPAKGSLSLIGRKVTVADGGDFTCSMIFKNGVTLNSTIHVRVLQILSSAETEILSGQRVNLSCSIGEPLASDIQLKWLLPEKSSVPKSDRHAARLTIEEASVGDSGKWKCELWQSGKQLTSAVIELKIEPRQTVWMLVIIGSVAVIVLLLLILTFILYQRRQRKTRHSRHRLCQCKNPKPKGFYRT